MLSHTLQLLTLLAAKLVSDAPVVLSQNPTGLPNVASLPDLSGVDQCVITCTMSAYTLVTKACPNMMDIACFCKNADFISISRTCMISTCPTAILPNAAAFATKMCGTVGVTLPASVTADPSPATSAPSATVSVLPSPASPSSSPVAPTPLPVAQANSSVAVGAISPIPQPALVSANSTSATPIPVVGNVVNTSIVTNTSTPGKPAASASTKVNQTTVTVPKVNATQQSKQSDESSGSVSIQATGIYMVLTTVVALTVL